MNRYTIRDYDKYLDMECGIYPHRIPLWQTKRIDESRGIVDDYLPIVDELYAALVNEMPMTLNIEESYLVYTLIDYKLKQDNVFLGSCTVVVLTRIEGGEV